MRTAEVRCVAVGSIFHCEPDAPAARQNRSGEAQRHKGPIAFFHLAESSLMRTRAMGHKDTPVSKTLGPWHGATLTTDTNGPSAGPPTLVAGFPPVRAWGLIAGGSEPTLAAAHRSCGGL